MTRRNAVRTKGKRAVERVLSCTSPAITTISPHSHTIPDIEYRQSNQSNHFAPILCAKNPGKDFGEIIIKWPDALHVPRTKTWKTRHFIKGPMPRAANDYVFSLARHIMRLMPAHTPKLKTQLSFEFTTTLHVRGSPAHLTSRRPKPILHQFQVLLYIV